MSIAEVRGQIAEVKPSAFGRHQWDQGFHLCNLTSDLCNAYVSMIQ